MTEAEAAEFVAGLPWRHVRMDRGPIHPHEYVIAGWREVPLSDFWAFVGVVRDNGYDGIYRAPYRPGGAAMKNRYWVCGPYVYWTIPPKQICRTPVEHRQHEPVSEPGGQRAPAPVPAQGTLW